MTLPADIRAKLKPMLGMVLGSEIEGQREAARQAINRVLAANQSDWHELVELLTPEPQPLPRWQPPAPSPSAGLRYEYRFGEYVLDGPYFRSVAEAIPACIRLNDWERGFLSSLKGQIRGSSLCLTEKQFDKLEQLLNRAARAAS